MIQWLLSKLLKSTKSINPRASCGVPGLGLFLGSQGEIMLRDAIGYAMLFGVILALMLAYFDCLTY
jgi:ABC-type Mn2+/Zn2+ transport system permease subunit